MDNIIALVIGLAFVVFILGMLIWAVRGSKARASYVPAPARKIGKHARGQHRA